MPSLRILPVMDLMAGEVVRGVGGRRQEYRPIVSTIAATSQPLDVARALRSHFGFGELYLADLDALAGGKPAFATYDALHKEGFRLWLDAGVREVTQACQLRVAGIASVIVGLETAASPVALGETVLTLGDDIVLSLDLHLGQPLGDRRTWGQRDAWEIAVQAIELGVCRLLVLDLAQVGRSEGTGTLALCARLHATYPHVELAAGGGVRDRSELFALRDSGVQIALVASALHDGRLTRADLQGL